MGCDATRLCCLVKPPRNTRDGGRPLSWRSSSWLPTKVPATTSEALAAPAEDKALVAAAETLAAVAEVSFTAIQARAVAAVFLAGTVAEAVATARA